MAESITVYTGPGLQREAAGAVQWECVSSVRDSKSPPTCVKLS